MTWDLRPTRSVVRHSLHVETSGVGFEQELEFGMLVENLFEPVTQIQYGAPAGNPSQFSLSPKVITRTHLYSVH